MRTVGREKIDGQMKSKGQNSSVLKAGGSFLVSFNLRRVGIAQSVGACT